MSQPQLSGRAVPPSDIHAGMAHVHRKSHVGEKPQQLPNTSYVTLTEAVTWIVTGNCRDDDYIAQKNFELWWNAAGPQWLLNHIAVLKQGGEWRFQPEISEAEIKLTLRDFEEARRWLAVQGCDAETAYQRVKEAVDDLISLTAELDLCHELIFRAAATQEIELVGIRRDYDTGELADDYEPIRFTFFLRPLRNSMGAGVHERSELSSPIYPFNRMLEEVFGRVYARPVYEKVMIRRDDVLEVQKRFAESQGEAGYRQIAAGSVQQPSRKGFSQGRLDRWYKEERVGKFDPTSGGTSKTDDLKLARQKFGDGVTRDAVRKARRKHAPAEWKRSGRRANSREI
jgi:hypothetical protein